MRKGLIGFVAMLAVVPLAIWLVPTASSAAMPASTTDGPYASMTPDSSSCGAAWAIDTYNRSFQVFTAPNSDGTRTVVEHFLNGKFLTLGDGQKGSAPSPGSCAEGTSHQLKEGVSGTFTGTFTIVVDPGATYTGTGGCALTNWGSMVAAWGSAGSDTPGDCAGSGDWVKQHFGSAAWHVSAFKITYHALRETYVQSDTGETGDITTS